MQTYRICAIDHPILIHAVVQTDEPSAKPNTVEERNQLLVLRALIGAKADVNLAGEESMRALHLSRTANVAKLLLDAGADPNALDCDRWTPLHWATYMGRLPVVKVLLAHGADYNIRDVDGQTVMGTDFLDKERGPSCLDFIRTVPFQACTGVLVSPNNCFFVAVHVHVRQSGISWQRCCGEANGKE